MRDTILPQAQNQLDEMANQMSQALSNQTTSGTAVTSGLAVRIQRRRRLAVAGQHRPAHLYRLQQYAAHDHDRVARCRRHAAAADSPSNPNNQTIGINFSGGMGSVVSQLNAALGTNLQFSNPSGTVLQVLNNGSSNVVNSLSATSTVTSLTSGSAQLPLFLDGTAPITGALNRERLANHGSRRAHHGQSRGCRVAIKPRRLCAEYRLAAIRRGRISCSIR